MAGPVNEGSDAPVWFSNRKTLVVLMVVLAASLSLPYFRKLNDWYPQTHPALLAIVAGIIVTVLSYPPMLYADPKYSFSSAVLLGLLTSEFVVYGAPMYFPPPLAISFFFFMFYYGRDEADHLWPSAYGKN